MGFFFIHQQLVGRFNGKPDKQFPQKIMLHFPDGFKINEVLAIEAEKLFGRHRICNLIKRLINGKLLLIETHDPGSIVPYIEEGNILNIYSPVLLAFKYQEAGLAAWGSQLREQVPQIGY